jgi:hypothetical protein
MRIYVDIDNTICKTEGNDYVNSKPILDNIEKINKLYNEGNTIIYWTARGAVSKIDYTDLTLHQLIEWGCFFTDLKMNTKPAYDLLICDKTKRIEEI